MSSELIEKILSNINYYLESFFFLDASFGIFGSFQLPLIVLWLIVGALFFTTYLNFINIRYFGHAIQTIRGKYYNPTDKGEIKHFQALVSAVSATVGLGNIAGVAIAVSIGGPGAVFWMIVMGFFSMSTKFAEVLLGHKFRIIDENGKISGGAFIYLRAGLAEMKLEKLGKILSIIFAICCIGGAIGAGNMFQSNQTVKVISNSFDDFTNYQHFISLTLAVMVGVVIIGGIKRIATVASIVVPFMAMVYIISALIILSANFANLGNAILLIISDAFSGEAVAGSMVGVIIQGVQRAVFSNEAGVGSAPIAHAPSKTNEPVQAGCIALLEPFLDTIVICAITGLVIVTTGVYADQEILQSGSDLTGVLLTSSAFATISDWFPKILAICVFLFAFSTMISWSYYGQNSWQKLFGKKYVLLYQIGFCVLIYLGGIVQNASLVIDFSTMLFFGMTIPNLIGIYLMRNIIKSEINQYAAKFFAKKSDKIL